MNEREDGAVEFDDCLATRETDAAILVRTRDADAEWAEEWIPKSQVHDDSEVYLKGHTGVLTVTGWFARKRGWI